MNTFICKRQSRLLAGFWGFTCASTAMDNFMKILWFMWSNKKQGTSALFFWYFVAFNLFATEIYDSLVLTGFGNTTVKLSSLPGSNLLHVLWFSIHLFSIEAKNFSQLFPDQRIWCIFKHSFCISFRTLYDWLEASLLFNHLFCSFVHRNEDFHCIFQAFLFDWKHESLSNRESA